MPKYANNMQTHKITIFCGNLFWKIFVANHYKSTSGSLPLLCWWQFDNLVSVVKQKQFPLFCQGLPGTQGLEGRLFREPLDNAAIIKCFTWARNPRKCDACTQRYAQWCCMTYSRPAMPRCHICAMSTWRRKCLRCFCLFFPSWLFLLIPPLPPWQPSFYLSNPRKNSSPCPFYEWKPFPCLQFPFVEHKHHSNPISTSVLSDFTHIFWSTCCC